MNIKVSTGQRVRFALAGRSQNAWTIAGLAAAVVFAWGASGCAAIIGETADGEATASPMARQVSMKREAMFNVAWRGKPRVELVDNLGQPKYVMVVPGRDDELTYVMVYGVQDRRAECVDAFTLQKNEAADQWVVSDYFCR